MADLSLSSINNNTKTTSRWQQVPVVMSYSLNQFIQSRMLHLEMKQVAVFMK